MMPLLDQSHSGHDKHLCTLVGKGIPLDEYKKLVKDGKYLCKICGRVANSDVNLCGPTTLD
ncbi:MAG: hypothetical protein ACFFD4_00340 [Candidatus Odinarchaeota archaeon]